MATLDLSMLEAAFEPQTGNGAPLLLPIESLQEDPANPRRDFDPEKLQSLAESVGQQGILQPIVVRAPVDGVYTIRFGARRYRAAKMAGLESVPVVVATDERHFTSYAQVAENEDREPLTPLDLAAFIKARLAAKDKKKDIAKGLRFPDSKVTYLCALIDPPAFLLELYHSGKCRTPQYLYQLRNLHETAPELVERRCAEAGDVIGGAFIRSLTSEVEAKDAPPGSQAASGAGAAPSALALGQTPPSAGDDRGAGAPEKRGQSRDPGEQADPTDKVRYKIIQVRYQDRTGQLMLNRRASPGLGWVKFSDDGSEVEAMLQSLMLDALIEA